MKLFSAVLSTSLLLLLVGARGNHSDPIRVRVLTYNIHHGEGTDRRFDLWRLAEVMMSVQPDIIALQEVDRGTDRAGGLDQLAELQRLLGMHAEFGKALDYAGGGYGVAVMARWPLLNPVNHPLPNSPDSEPRTALTVHLRTSETGPLLRFTSTHLAQGRGSGDRLLQARYLNELLLADDEQPSILAGDLNARPGTDAMEVFDTHWTNAAAVGPPQTVPTRRRRQRGDYVLFRPAENWRVIETRVIDDRLASDHRPLLTVLKWIEGS